MEGVVKSRESASYRCPWCGGVIPFGSGNALECTTCARSYPVVDSIPVLTLRPRAQLGWQMRGLRGGRLRVDRLRYQTLSENARVRTALEGMDANLQLIFDCMREVDASHQSQDDRASLIDILSNVGGAWSPGSMLPYFYQDWAPTPDFEHVSGQVAAAAERHLPRRGSVTVLGAGACGLAYRLAAEYFAVYAIDLSLPTLLLARKLLYGQSIELYMQGAAWRRASIKAPAIAPDRLTLLVGDAYKIPLLDGSQSLVITQYVMDILENPIAVIDEINRVLEHDGIWINFSMPFRLRGEPTECGRVSLDDLESLLARQGFSVSEKRTEKFCLLNLESLDCHAGKDVHPVHFFVARKTTSSFRRSAALAAVLNSSDWWESVPEFEFGAIVAVQKSTQWPIGSENTHAWGMQLNATHFNVAQYQAECMEEFFRMVDAHRPWRSIRGELIERGFETDSPDLVECHYHLSTRHGVLRQWC